MEIEQVMSVLIVIVLAFLIFIALPCWVIVVDKKSYNDDNRHIILQTIDFIEFSLSLMSKIILFLLVTAALKILKMLKVIGCWFCSRKRNNEE